MEMNSIQNDNYYAGDQYASTNHMGGGGGPGQKSGARPMVDPEYLGEVDVEKYPEPKDSTKKVRGRYDILEMLCGTMSQELLIAKTFYLFFFSAFGSLFPLMGVYFKQMGMNPGQCGVLMGLRPFIEFVSAPFWGGIADRYQKGKVILLASLGCWIIFTMSISFIQPPATACLEDSNNTHWRLKTPTPSMSNVDKRSVSEEDYWVYVKRNSMRKRSADPYEDTQEKQKEKNDILKRLTYDGDLLTVEEFQQQSTHVRRKRAANVKPQGYAIGMSPYKVEYVTTAEDYDKDEDAKYISPPNTNVVYTADAVQKVFFLLLLIVVLGEFFSAPAITMADSSVLSFLGEDADQYGWQRMFGSMGWGITMFFVGIALDHSTSFPDHLCEVSPRERNYTICFAVFSVLMGCAIIAASQLTFHYKTDDTMAMKTVDNQPQQPEAVKEEPPKINLEGNPVAGLVLDTDVKKPAPEICKSKVFAQTTKQMPEWVKTLKYFANLKCGLFLFIAWFMGMGVGLIFTFLFWHLQEYGGTPTLFGVASVINHVSEIFAYFFSFRLISQLGHIKLLCMGLVGNVIRFLYISWLKNPWWVLPFEFMQGITHATVWATCCSYIAHNTPPELRASTQGVLQGIHHGLGRGCGTLIGGIFVTYLGTKITFRIYGFMCLLILIVFVFVNFYKGGKFMSEISEADDPRQVAEASHLAPHGVPSNPMPRALSSSKLNEIPDSSSYGATESNQYQQESQQHFSGGGASTNPFLQASGGGDMSGGGGGYMGGGGGMQFSSEAPRIPLEGAFNLRMSPLASGGALASPEMSSPEAVANYEFIRRNFKEYNAVLSSLIRNSEEDSDESDDYSARPPKPVTALHAPQPGASNTADTYAW